MHRAFHVERQYVATQPVPVRGCTQASNLKLKFVAHVGEVATQTIRQRRKLVGIDVILVHRMLKNPVEMPEYVLLSEELYRTGSAGLTPSVGRVEPAVDGFGTVTAFYVDVRELDPGAGALPAPTWRGRLSRTVYAAGAGLPYMLGRRGRGRTTSAVG